MKNAASVFFVGFPGVRVSGKQCKCMDTCFFCAPTGAAKMLVGVAPQTVSKATARTLPAVAPNPLKGSFMKKQHNISVTLL